MQKQVFIFVSLLVLLTVPSALLAQSQFTTGGIAGTVTDESGAVMPGVTVTLSGERVAGSQTFVTGPRGSYRFTGLPPGAYDLTYEMDGFATLSREQITVSVGGTVDLNVTLQLSNVAETVTVTGEQPVVDTRSTRINTTYDREWVENAPIRRFVFFDYLNSAPGISPSSFDSSNQNVLGSGGDENTYQLDGVDITASAFGNSWPWPDIDAIEEVEVLSLGAPAEYANAAGAVFNIVTRQGSNEFRGDVNMYIQTDGLTGRNTSEEEDDGLPYRRDEFTDFTGQLGGPIAKDKLWFFSGYQRQIDSDSQPGADSDFPTSEEKDSFIGKLNYQINDANKISFMYHIDYFDLPDTASANDAPSSVGTETGKTQAVNLGYTNVLSQDTLLEAHFSGFWSDDHFGPIGEEFPRIGPRFYNFDTGEVTGAPYIWYDADIFKTAINAKVTHYAEDFLGGSHDFKFGVQWNRGGTTDGTYGYNDLIYTYEYNGQSYAYGYDYDYFAYSGVATNIGLWVDDSWTVNERLTVNLGLRYDHKRASVDDLVVKDADGNATGEEFPGIDNLFTWTPVSPRIGFNYQLTEDGGTIIKAHYGRYYRAIITCEYCLSIGSSPRVYFAGDYDLETGTFFNTEVDAIIPGSRGIDPNYRNPYTDQFVIGFDRELGNQLALQVNYAYKRGNDYAAWRDIAGVYEPAVYIDDQGADATGQPIPVLRLVSDRADRSFLIGNDDRLKTRIHALTVQVAKRMSDNWQLNSSFSYLKTDGAVATEPGRSDNEPTADGDTALHFSSFGQNPNDFVNLGGRLPGERPWIFKTQVLYQFPHDFLVAVNYVGQSGKAWPREVRLDSDITGIGSTINAELRDGSRLVDDWHLLDVRLQKLFQIGPRARVGAFFDFLNVLNSGANENVLSLLGTSDVFGVRSEFLPPRRVMIGARLTF